MRDLPGEAFAHYETATAKREREAKAAVKAKQIEALNQIRAMHAARNQAGTQGQAAAPAQAAVNDHAAVSDLAAVNDHAAAQTSKVTGKRMAEDDLHTSPPTKKVKPEMKRDLSSIVGKKRARPAAGGDLEEGEVRETKRRQGNHKPAPTTIPGTQAAGHSKTVTDTAASLKFRTKTLKSEAQKPSNEKALEVGKGKKVPQGTAQRTPATSKPKGAAASLINDAATASTAVKRRRPAGEKQETGPAKKQKMTKAKVDSTAEPSRPERPGVRPITMTMTSAPELEKQGAGQRKAAAAAGPSKVTEPAVRRVRIAQPPPPMRFFEYLKSMTAKRDAKASEDAQKTLRKEGNKGAGSGDAASSSTSNGKNDSLGQKSDSSEQKNASHEQNDGNLEEKGGNAEHKDNSCDQEDEALGQKESTPGQEDSNLGLEKDGDRRLSEESKGSSDDSVHDNKRLSSGAESQSTGASSPPPAEEVESKAPEEPEDSDAIPQPEKRSPPVGLDNHRNACYFNCVFQLLNQALDPALLKEQLDDLGELHDFGVPDAELLRSTDLDGGNQIMRDEIMAHIKTMKIPEHLQAAHLIDILEKMSETGSDWKVISPFVAQYLYGATNSQFDGLTQQDPAELLQSMLNYFNEKLGVHATCVRSLFEMPDVDPDKIQYHLEKLFRVESIIRRTCKGCGAQKESEDKEWILSLPLQGDDSTTLRNLILTKMHPNEIDCECDQCDQTKFKEQVIYKQLPENVVMRIERAASQGSLKKKGQVKVPMDGIDLGRLLAGASHSQMYEVTGVVKHDGESLRQGHYTSYVHPRNDEWWLCNDSEVTKVPQDDWAEVWENDGDTTQAYLLLFQKKHSK